MSTESTQTPPASSTEKKGTGLNAIIIPALFTLLGALVGVLGNGYFGLILERQKSDTELVKLAIQNPDEKIRIESLRFMVGTNLILDSEIRKGVSNYLPSTPDTNQKVVPQIVPVTQLKFPSVTRILAAGDPQLQFLNRNFSKLAQGGIVTDPPRKLEDDTRPKTNEVRFFHAEDQQAAARIEIGRAHV